MSAADRGSRTGSAISQRSRGRNATIRCALTAVMKLAPSAAATAPAYSSGALTVSTSSSQNADSTTHQATQNKTCPANPTGGTSDRERPATKTKVHQSRGHKKKTPEPRGPGALQSVDLLRAARCASSSSAARDSKPLPPWYRPDPEPRPVHLWPRP